MPTKDNDTKFMKIALRLARRGLGNVAPNPSVGCVIVNNGKIVGRGWTAQGGRPHAETLALKQAQNKAEGATVYVTLEPCAHFGKTPPCADSLIKAGVKRVVIATPDPFKKVNGSGIAKLRNAGIKTEIGLCEKDAKELNIGFFMSIACNRPFVTLKIVTTTNGKITTPEGKTSRISGDKAINLAHLLRYNHDAIMVGIGTIIADNPHLDCRLPGLHAFSPLKVIIDSNLRTPEDANVIKDKNNKTIIFTKKGSQKNFLENVKIKEDYNTQNKNIDIKYALEELCRMGITRLLVEGGGEIASTLFKYDLIDELIWIKSTKVTGDESAPSIEKLIKENLHKFRKIEKKELENDIIYTYKSVGQY